MLRWLEMIIFPLLLLVLVTGCQSPPETAESILQKVITAHGGDAALREARGYLFHGHIQSLRENDHGKLWILYRRPMQLRVTGTLTASKEDRLFLAGKGWVDTGKGLSVVSGMALDLMAFQAEHLDLPYRLLEGNYQVVLLEEVVEDKPARLLLTDGEGLEMTISVDPVRWVVRTVERELASGETTVKFGVVYEEYRTVKGVQLPFRILNYVNGQPIGRTDFQSVQTNPSLPENVFSAPGKGAR